MIDCFERVFPMIFLQSLVLILDAVGFPWISHFRICQVEIPNFEFLVTVSELFENSFI